MSVESAPTGLRAVVFGTGFGTRTHVRALRIAGIEVLALVGTDWDRTSRRAAKAGVAIATTAPDEAMALQPNIVVVATPPATHADIVRQALNAGRHVMCEKPFTLDADEARELTELAEAKGLVAYLGHEFRFAECAAHVGALLQEGAIGVPKLATFIAHNSMVADPRQVLPDWWFDEARGGGWLGASGSHAVDRVRHWFGEIASVSASLSVTSERKGVADDTCQLMFRTVSGVEVCVQTTAGAWGPPLTITRVAGTNGTLWIDDRDGLGAVEAVAGPVFRATAETQEVVDTPDALTLRRPEGLEEKYARDVLPYARLYQRMAMAIQGIEPPSQWPEPATFRDGAINMGVLDAARSSARDGGSSIALDLR